MESAEKKGELAYLDGLTSQQNPFDFYRETEQYKEWNHGYNVARNHAEHVEEDSSDEGD